MILVGFVFVVVILYVYFLFSFNIPYLNSNVFQFCGNMLNVFLTQLSLYIILKNYGCGTRDEKIMLLKVELK